MRTFLLAGLLILAFNTQAKNLAVQVLKAGTALTDTLGIGQPAVPFSLTTPEGAVLSSEQLKGKVVVLDFWATWCSPCRKLTHEIDSLISTIHTRKDFQMIGVSYRETNKAAAVKYWTAQAYKFPMAGDENVLGKAIQAGNPTIVVIDKKGIVRGRWDKYSHETALEVKKTIDALL